MIKTILLVDLKTGGLDPKKDPIVEIGVVLWSVEFGTTLNCWSTLIHGYSNEAESINRIPAKALQGAMLLPDALKTLQHFVLQSDVLIAHRAEFDFSFLAHWNQYHDLPQLTQFAPIVCSKFDLEWPHSKVGDGLVHIALANGIGISSAHRALTDCMILARLFERMYDTGADLQAMLQRGLRPKALFQACVPYERKDEAKAASFTWDGDRKRWTRRMCIEDAGKLPFKAIQVPS